MSSKTRHGYRPQSFGHNTCITTPCIHPCTPPNDVQHSLPNVSLTLLCDLNVLRRRSSTQEHLVPSATPLSPRSPRPDIGRALLSSRQRWHVLPAERPLLLHATAVRTVLGGTSSLHPPPPPFCAPSSMKWEPFCLALYITSCAGARPVGGHSTAAKAAGPSITPGSRSGRSVFGTPLSVSFSFRFSLCLAKNNSAAEREYR